MYGIIGDKIAIELNLIIIKMMIKTSVESQKGAIAINFVRR